MQVIKKRNTLETFRQQKESITNYDSWLDDYMTKETRAYMFRSFVMFDNTTADVINPFNIQPSDTQVVNYYVGTNEWDSDDESAFLINMTFPGYKNGWCRAQLGAFLTFGIYINNIPQCSRSNISVWSSKHGLSAERWYLHKEHRAEYEIHDIHTHDLYPQSEFPITADSYIRVQFRYVIANLENHISPPPLERSEQDWWFGDQIDIRIPVRLEVWYYEP